MLNIYYAPERTAATLLLSNLLNAFVTKNIEVELYTPFPSRGITKAERKEYKKYYKYNQDNTELLQVYRFNLFPEYNNLLLKTIRSIFCLVKEYFLVKDKKGVDVLWVSSTPPFKGYLVKKLRKRLGCKVIYLLQDIFPDSLVGTGLAKKGGILWKIGRKIEDFTYRNVDKIIVISEDFKRNIMAKGVPEEKIEVIYNWVDEKAVVPIEKKDNPLFEELGISRDLFHVVYAGNLGHAQNVQVLLDCAKRLRNERGIEFVVLGTGGLKEEYEKYARENELNNVKFFPLQPMEKVAQVYSMADVALVSCKKGLGGSAMPSKTWSILSAGTPVVCSFDKGGDLQRIIEDNQLGLFSEAGDVEGLVENVLFFYQNKEICREYGKNGRAFIEKNLTREVGTAKYVQVLKQFEKK